MNRGVFFAVRFSYCFTGFPRVEQRAGKKTHRNEERELVTHVARTLCTESSDADI